LNFLVGALLKKTEGKGSPLICKERLLKKLI
jgi:Asp-tRNA(Asn)/Glu-tRNA(Gln) amidotransferase B subunit